MVVVLKDKNNITIDLIEINSEEETLTLEDLAALSAFAEDAGYKEVIIYERIENVSEI